MPTPSLEAFHEQLLTSLQSCASANSTHTWQATRDASTIPAPDHSPSSAQVSAVLTFSGTLSGCLALTTARSSVHLLLGESPNPDLERAWLDVAQSVGNRLAADNADTVVLLDGKPADQPLHPHPLLPPITFRSSDEHTAFTVTISADQALLAHLSPSSNLHASATSPAPRPTPLDRVIDVPLAVTLRFGQRHLTLREVLDLNSGSLLELDRQVEEPVDLVLGDRVIARGEVMIIDGNYGMRVTEVLDTSGRRSHARSSAPSPRNATA